MEKGKKKEKYKVYMTMKLKYRTKLQTSINKTTYRCKVSAVIIWISRIERDHIDEKNTIFVLYYLITASFYEQVHIPQGNYI